MTQLPAGPSSPSRLRSWLPLALAVTLALAYLGWILAHWSPAIMSPDANGYVVQGRLLATHGQAYLTTQSPAQFVGTHWLETDHGVFYSRYPAGLPILFALAWKLGGLRAALLINPLLASGTILLVFFLARRLADDWSALLAATIWATNATAQAHALDADSHTAATFFLTAGLLALWRFTEHRSWWRGLIAGLLLGIVPTVRYPEAIAGLVIGLWLLWFIRPIWKLWPAVAGAALPVGALLIHNAAAYGQFWRTGYALTGEQTGFGWNYFSEHALSYLQNLSGPGLGLFFAFGAAGIAGLVAGRKTRPFGVLLAGLTVTITLLYMAYYFGQGEGSLRFLIPTFPLFAIAGAWFLGRMREALGTAGRAAWMTVVILQLGAATWSSAETATRTGASLKSAVQVHTLLAQKAPAGSVVLVDHQLGESLEATGEWRLAEANLVGGTQLGGPGGMGMGGMGGLGGGPGGPMMGRRAMGGRRAAGGGAGDGPSPQQANKNRAQHARYDHLPEDERQARVWADLAAWSGGKPIYWLARSVDAVEAALPDGADYQVLGTVDAPTGGMPGMAGGDGMGPGRMGGGMAGGPPTGRFQGGAGARSQKLSLVKIVWAKK